MEEGSQGAAVTAATEAAAKASLLKIAITNARELQHEQCARAVFVGVLVNAPYESRFSAETKVNLGEVRPYALIRGQSLELLPL